MTTTEKDKLNLQAKRIAKKYFPIVEKQRNGKIVEVLKNGTEIDVDCCYNLPFPLLQNFLIELKKDIFNTGKKFKLKCI